jgi:uncharacterized membrane protein YbhN (UPF0104 family)
VRKIFAYVSTAVLLGLILWWAEPATIWESLQAANLGVLGLALLITPVVIGLKIWRWLLLARTVDPEFSIPDAARSYLVGLALATVTPLAAGEAMRGMFVKGGNRAQLTGKTILDKFIDLASLSLFAGVGLLFIDGSLKRGIGALLCLVFVGFVFALFVVTPRLAGKLDHLSGIWAKLRIPQVADAVLHTPASQLLRTILISLVGFCVYYVQVMIVMRAFLPTASLELMVYFPIITLSTILPIGVGGTGVRETVAVILLSTFGVSKAVAFNSFFIHFIIVQGIPAILGAVLLASARKNDAQSLTETD